MMPGGHLVDGRFRHREPVGESPDRVMGYAEWWADEPKVLIGNTVAPQRIDIDLVGDGYQPGYKARIEIIGGVPQCRMLAVESVEGGREVTALDIKAIRVNDFIDVAIGSSAMDFVDQHADGSRVITRTSYGPKTVASAHKAVQRARTPRTITDGVLRNVAEVYRSNLDGNPVEAVGKSFGVKHRTAANYVQRARAAGHLPPTTPGKKMA